MEKTYKTLKYVLLALCVVALVLGAVSIFHARTPAGEAPAPVVTQAAESLPSETEPLPSETETRQATEATVQMAPDFTVYDRDGNAHKLSDFQGKPVILNFWASWCGPCKGEMPDFEKAYQQYGDEIHFLMVNLTDGSYETVEIASEFIAGQNYTFPVYFDSDSDGAMHYGVNAIPVTYFINADGALLAGQSGMLSADILQKGIDLLLTQ